MSCQSPCRSSSDVVLGPRWTGSWVLGRVVILGRAVGTEESTAHDEEACGPPADEERSSELPFLGAHCKRVVEVVNDGVRRPAHGDEAHHTSEDEDHTRRHTDFSFGALILHAVGALAPCDGQEDSKDADQNGDDDEGAGSLEVSGERQHGVVNLALHLARALNHTAHPDALPSRLSSHNVLADEGRHFPLGQGADDDGPNPSDNAEGDAQHL